MSALRISPASPLAPYACDPAGSRGRLHPEDDSPTRSAFQRDRDRIIHSTAFRRLKHKTQVFVYHEGDHYRTRLTHSLEVSQIARSICRVLGLNEDLTEALALAHDLGHTAFGHAGEEALDARMQPFGGFDHNAQALRVVTRLEHRYAEFDGLNLSWETLEGIAKHNGPLLPSPPGKPLAFAFRSYNARHDLELESHASAEAQVAALADDIAYNNHDIDDGLRAGLFTLDDLRAVEMVDQVIGAVLARYPGLEPQRLAHETVRRLIALMVEDVIAETRARVAAAGPASAADVRALGRPLVAFSAAMAAREAALKQFLRQHMYRHYKVQRMTAKARRMVASLFDLYFANPALLPAEWQRAGTDAGQERHARAVADYIAGMTDAYAMRQYARHFGAEALEQG
ncbi:MAG: deoxyguanosinetriphosphate triphosphohydrolase [Sphingomonadales bacterium]